MRLIDCKCGGKPQLKEQTGWWCVECPKCKCGTTEYPTREKAVDTWNYCCRVDARLKETKRGEGKQSEPPRNCDRFNSGDVKKDAQAALEAYLAEGVAGYRAVAEWLLSPVTEGGSNETKD